MKILVTGGSGFIGSALVRHIIGDTLHSVCNLDAMTYAASYEATHEAAANVRYSFRKGDIGDARFVESVLADFQPDAVVHLAAESHVDRSIDAPSHFVQTNIVGTYTLLETVLRHWQGIDTKARDAFRFIHVSTDEVFGDLAADDPQFDETTAYKPSSPYSASKAASDHLARAWHRTFGLPVIVTNCSNNYGPFQFPEKLIPVIIENALLEKPLPVYGDGKQIRDWLYVEDHARALMRVVDGGQVGETYLIGGANEMRNIDVVKNICALLDQAVPRRDGRAYADLIHHVTDRPGHDTRYAINASHIQAQLGWAPRHTFKTGLAATVDWFLSNRDWCARMSARQKGGVDKRQGLGEVRS